MTNGVARHPLSNTITAQWGIGNQKWSNWLCSERDKPERWMPEHPVRGKSCSGIQFLLKEFFLRIKAMNGKCLMLFKVSYKEAKKGTMAMIFRFHLVPCSRSIYFILLIKFPIHLFPKSWLNPNLTLFTSNVLSFILFVFPMKLPPEVHYTFICFLLIVIWSIK